MAARLCRSVPRRLAAASPASADMPSVSCAAVSRPPDRRRLAPPQFSCPPAYPRRGPGDTDMSAAMNTETELRGRGVARPTPRLLRTGSGIEDVAEYRRAGGYRALDDPSAARRGRAQRTGRPRRRGVPDGSQAAHGARRAAVRAADTVVLANGEEGEPASVKDRWLLRNRPHLVLDGVRLAARIVGAAARARLRVRSACGPRRARPRWRRRHRTSTSRSASSPWMPATSPARRPPPCAPSTADRPKPTDKPPRPFQEGVGGQPTLVSNVETLANLPFILRHGARGVTAHRARRRRLEHSWPR